VDEQQELDPRVGKHLEPGERIRVKTEARDAVLAVTDRRLVVADEARLALAVPLDHIRRVQFDIERRRPATLVIVPEAAHDEPQVLAIRLEDYRAAADALVYIGQAIAAEPT
jgi:hypothetical protein